MFLYIENIEPNDCKIFLQIMHSGRVSHEANLPEGGKVIAPSAISVDVTADVAICVAVMALSSMPIVPIFVNAISFLS